MNSSYIHLKTIKKSLMKGLWLLFYKTNSSVFSFRQISDQLLTLHI
jgi:hypothetical protein